MINAIIGSIIGTAITLGLLAMYVEYSTKKKYEKAKKDMQEMIEKLTTFKIKVEDVL